MKEDVTRIIKYSLYMIELFLLAYTIIIFIFKESLSTLIYPINVSFFMLLTFASIKLFGYVKNKKSRAKTKLNNKFILFSIIYLLIVYLIDGTSSFDNNSYSFINSLYIIIYMFISEIFRYIFLTKCNKNNNHHFIITFLFILFDIFLLSELTLNNFYTTDTLINISLVAIIKNSVLSYTSYKYGYIPCFIYSFIISTMPLVIPSYPNIGSYLTLTIIIIYSAILLYYASKPIHRDDEESKRPNEKDFFFYLERALLVVIVCVIFLVSGAFKYSISAIASDSMYPELKKGDAIILERVDESNKDTLKKGMIVAFKQDEYTITHRILEIEKIKGTEYIITKGDNNSTKDIQKKTKDDIIGIVRFRIPLLGYPSIEISETKNK